MAKILFLSANPIGENRLNRDVEYHQITYHVRIAGNYLKLELAPAVDEETWQTELNVHNPDVVHFSGHGSSGGRLMLVEPDGHWRFANPQVLKKIFHFFKDTVRLVVLNACNSLSQAEAIVDDIECVIAMNGEISDKAAIAFAGKFYQALGSGKSVQNAFEQGKIVFEAPEFKEYENVPQLLERPGVHASEIVLVELVQQQESKSTSVNKTTIQPSGTVGTPLSLFYIHAPEDETFCREVDKHFAYRRRKGQIKSFYSAQMLGGDEEPEINRQQLLSAHIILIAITPDLLLSDKLVEQQLDPAWELYKKGKKVIPIMVKRTDEWKGTKFKDVFPIPRNGKAVYDQSRERAIADVAEEISRVINGLKKP